MKQLFSPNFNERPKNTTINSIIIHYTVVDKGKTISIFQDEKKEVSSHYLIDKEGEVIIFVDPQKRAWHAGVSYWKGVKNLNNNSIGIEIENNGQEKFSKIQYQSLIKLILQLKKLYPSIKDEFILGHADIAPDRKIDPGKYFLWEELYKNNIGIYHDIDIHNYKIIAKIGGKGEEVKMCQILLKKLGYNIKIDGIYSKKTAKVVNAFKMHFCRKNIDDVWDEYAATIIKVLIEKTALS